MNLKIIPYLTLLLSVLISYFNIVTIGRLYGFITYNSLAQYKLIFIIVVLLTSMTFSLFYVIQNLRKVGWRGLLIFIISVIFALIIHYNIVVKGPNGGFFIADYLRDFHDINAYNSGYDTLSAIFFIELTVILALTIFIYNKFFIKK